MIVRGWTNILRDIFLASTVSRRDSHPPSSSATSEYLLYSACPPSTSAMDLWIFRKTAMMLTVFSAKKFSASLSVSSLVFVPNVRYVTKLGKKLVPRLPNPSTQVTTSKKYLILSLKAWRWREHTCSFLRKSPMAAFPRDSIFVLSRHTIMSGLPSPPVVRLMLTRPGAFSRRTRRITYRACMWACPWLTKVGGRKVPLLA